MSKPSAGKSFWWVTLATVVGMAITAALGQWQLGRAAQKEERATQQQARRALPPLGWPELQQALLSADGTAWQDRSVHLRGRWVPDATVFLDNRPLNGRAGFWLLTPLQPEDTTDTAILVLRAWVPRRFDDRTAIPPLPATADVVEVTGRLAPPPSKLYELGADERGRIRQNIDVPAYAREQSLPLLTATVWQTAGDELPADWSRDWPPANVDVHKHYGYALQWFGLCLLMAILYAWFQFIAPRRRARNPTHANTP